MVAGRLTGEGIDEDQIAVWATNNIATASLTFSVNGLASEFSGLGTEGRGEEFSPDDDGADEAIACVEKA